MSSDLNLRLAATLAVGIGIAGITGRNHDHACSRLERQGHERRSRRFMGGQGDLRGSHELRDLRRRLVRCPASAAERLV